MPGHDVASVSHMASLDRAAVHDDRRRTDRAAIPGRSQGAAVAPCLPFRHLDTLWLQVTGTLCNLRCTHCFISCGPDNDTVSLMPRDQVLGTLARAPELGVREFYYTGGEPFLHPDIRLFIERGLEVAPVTVLTNGILITERQAEWLGALFSSSRYSLDIRISLDGLTAEQNDAVRGAGTFAKIIRAVGRLAARGLVPAVAVTEVHEGMGAPETRLAFLALLRSLGCRSPRVKFLPVFRLGAQAERLGGYAQHERLAEGDLAPEEYESLQCSSARLLAADGVYPCPLLLGQPGARMGPGLDEGLHDVRLAHGACVTCHLTGMTCRT